MRALVFHRPKHVSVDTVPDPIIEQPTDAILRVSSTAICGSDLHILNGLFPQPKPQILGHEFMGTVVEVGSSVTKLKKGDRVVVPFPISCGLCWFCEHHLPTACSSSNPDHYGPEGGVLDNKGGGLFGYTDLYGGYSGGQAEYVRVPYADVGPRKVPDNLTDDQALFLTDIFPTGWTAIDWAQLKGGETVAVFGAGPVGLMAMKSAWLQGAGRVIGIDSLSYRLERARTAAKAETIDITQQDPVEALRAMTHGRGPDVCVDAVGLEADRTWIEKASAVIHMERGTKKVIGLCCSAVRRGGTVTIVGVYGTSYDNFPVGQIFDKGLTLRHGQAPVHNYIDHLLELVSSGRVRLDDVISHRLPLADAAKGYQIFNDREDDCVKVVLKP